MKLLPGTDYQGPPDLKLDGPCGIDAQAEGRFTYITKDEMLEQYVEGEAALCLTPMSVESCAKPILRCPNPRVASGILCEAFAPADVRKGMVHPSATVEDSAELGRT